MKLRLYFYKSSNGREVILDYVNSLDGDTEEFIKAFLFKFIDDENYRTMPYCRKLGGDIFEIRIKTKSIYRILYAYIFGDSVILLHIFRKQSDKTPLREIKLAKNRLKEYEQ